MDGFLSRRRWTVRESDGEGETASEKERDRLLTRGVSRRMTEFAREREGKRAIFARRRFYPFLKVIALPRNFPNRFRFLIANDPRNSCPSRKVSRYEDSRLGRVILCLAPCNWEKLFGRLVLSAIVERCEADSYARARFNATWNRVGVVLDPTEQCTESVNDLACPISRNREIARELLSDARRINWRINEVYRSVNKSRSLA